MSTRALRPNPRGEISWTHGNVPEEEETPGKVDRFMPLGVRDPNFKQVSGGRVSILFLPNILDHIRVSQRPTFRSPLHRLWEIGHAYDDMEGGGE